MDIYLPADFHELHDDAAEDWRDLSTAARTDSERATPRDRARTARASDSFNDCADPFWRVL